MEQKSYRKPYIRPIKASWWLKRPVYILYMLREFTAVVNVWVAVELLAIMAFALGSDAQAQISALIQHPAAIVLNILALIASLYHMFTWFNIFPIGVRIFVSRKPDETRMVPWRALTVVCYGMTAAASALIIWALTCA